MQRFVSPGFVLGALLALMGAAASMLAVNHALAKLPELFRLCLGISVSLFPMYASVRAYTALGELTEKKWIRGLVAIALLVTGHGGIIVVAARQAGMDPIALLAEAIAAQ